MDAGIRGWVDGRTDGRTDLCGGDMITRVPDVERHGRHGRGDGRAGYMTRCGAVRILLPICAIRYDAERMDGGTDGGTDARTLRTRERTLGHGHAQTYRHRH